jgi:hypothetical protein
MPNSNDLIKATEIKIIKKNAAIEHKIKKPSYQLGFRD